MRKPLVSIVMGSDSDLEIMREASNALDGFGISYEIDVTSAHRSPDRTAEYARNGADACGNSSGHGCDWEARCNQRGHFGRADPRGCRLSDCTEAART
jgi:hypothetical protein